MAYTNRKGVIGDFKIGYLQREIILHQCKVTNGTDASVHNPDKLGFLVGRIVKVTKDTNGIYTITAPENADEPLNDGTHIIAQSDNTMRNEPADYIPTEHYSTRYDGIVKNTDDSDYKAVAVYEIVNKDDIQLIDITKGEDE